MVLDGLKSTWNLDMKNWELEMKNEVAGNLGLKPKLEQLETWIEVNPEQFSMELETEPEKLAPWN